MHAIDLSAAWAAPAAAGLPWTRNFGRPSGLAAAGPIWLVIAAPVPPVAELNGVPLKAGSVKVANAAVEVWFEIAALLRPRNTLTVLPQSDDGGDAAAHGVERRPLPASCGRVRLEIA